MKIRLLRLVPVVAVSLVGALAQAKTSVDVLVIGKSADPQSLDPAVTMDNNDWTVTYPAYQRLVQYKVEGGRGSTLLEGDLAQSWTTSSDGLTWDFKLKTGARFADGSPVDAAAVKFSFDRLFAIKAGPSQPFPAATTVSVVDPSTVRFELKVAFAPFLAVLATDGASVVNPKAMLHEENGDRAKGWLAGHTMGSGAYQLSSWQKGQSIVMEKSPYASGGTFSKVIIKIIPESSARRLQLQGGDIDIAEDLPADQLGPLQAQGAQQRVAVTDYPSLKVTYLYLNNKRPPLNNADVRRAVVAAVDAQAIVDGILLGRAKPLAAPIPEGMWGHDASIQPAVLAPAQAKRLLAQAGVKDVTLSFLVSDKDPTWDPIALTVQSNLGDVGLAVKLESMSNATYRNRVFKGDFDIAIGNWSPDFADPFAFMNYGFETGRQGAAGNRSFYSNPRVDALLAKAASAGTVPERTRLYQEAQTIVVGEAANVYLFQRNSPFAARTAVHGHVYNPMLEQIYNFATMSKSE